MARMMKMESRDESVMRSMLNVFLMLGLDKMMMLRRKRKQLPYF